MIHEDCEIDTNEDIFEEYSVDVTFEDDGESDGFEEFAANFIFEDEDEEKQEEESERDARPRMSFAEELYLFFILFSIPHNAMKYLLLLLRRFDIDVPKTLYKLQKNSFSIKSLNIKNDSHFAYLGVRNNLLFAFERNLLRPSPNSEVNLDMKVNVDGLPLYRSSSINLWPILCTFTNMTCIFPLGIFCGIGKPNLRQFLEKFIDEIHDMKRSPLINNIVVRISSLIFVCDAPARAFLQCVKGHTSFRGCAYCRQQGRKVNDTVIFETTVRELRMNEVYSNFKENNQIELSPLSSIVPLRSNFPPDYMHCVLLGVTRKLFYYFFTSTKGRRLSCRISKTQMNILNHRVNELKVFVPKEFHRKIRPFCELSHFKASELRTYLLYFGPVLFSQFLPQRYFEHFQLLHFAITVYSSSQFCHLHEQAERCLEIFVFDMPTLFGEESLVYNVHSLLHLSEFVRLYGPLDRFSAFPFENYLSILKRRLKVNNAIFQQSINQLLTIREIYQNLSSPTTLSFSTKHPNMCAIHKSKMVLVNNVNDDGTITGNLLIFHKNLYNHPYPSQTLSIGYYKKSSQIIGPFVPSNKAICIPYKNYYIALPFVKS